ncbi:MAG: LysR family transcriptional regulator [Myxococcota bacterium]
MSLTAPLDGLDLNQLVVLEALLTESSVTRAAHRLGKAQPSLSRSLEKLRVAFDDPLLVRSGRGMRLTPFAARLVEPLGRALNAIRRLRDVGAFDPSTSSRHFRLIVPDVFAVAVVGPLLAYLREHSSITVSLLAIEAGSLRKLLADEVDLAMANGPFEDGSLRARAVHLPPEWCVLGGPQAPAGPLSLQDWLDADHVQIIPGSDPDGPSGLDLALRSRGMHRRIRAKVAYLSALRPILLHSPCLCSLPAVAGRSLEGGGIRLFAHPLADRMPVIDAWLSWPEHHHADPAHRWLRELVVRLLRSEL